MHEIQAARSRGIHGGADSCLAERLSLEGYLASERSAFAPYVRVIDETLAGLSAAGMKVNPMTEIISNDPFFRPKYSLRWIILGAGAVMVWRGQTGRIEINITDTVQKFDTQRRSTAELSEQIQPDLLGGWLERKLGPIISQYFRKYERQKMGCK